MKRVFFPVLLALAIMATSCIKNEESEGVKSMRTSQAELLSAMASATTTTATAQAALQTAQAAYQTALAEDVKAKSAADVAAKTIANAKATEESRSLAALNALKETLQAATDAKTKVSLTEQIKIEQANTAFQLKLIENNMQSSTMANARQAEMDRNAAAMNALNEALKTAQNAEIKANLTQQMAEEAVQSAIKLQSFNNQLDAAIADKAIQKANNDKNLLYAQLDLDAAQKLVANELAKAKIEYDKNIEMLKIQATTAKNDVASALIAQYNSAFNMWNSTNANIYSYNQQILSNQVALKNAEIDAPSFVNTIKAQLDAASRTVAQRTADLQRAQLPLDKYKAELKAEIAALNKELPAANADYDAAYAENQKASFAYSNAFEAYNKVYTSILNHNPDYGIGGIIYSSYNSLTQRNEYSGKIPAYNKADNDLRNAEMDTLTVHNNYFHILGWLHYKSNPRLYVNSVTLDKAVDAEKLDVDASGKYLTPLDEADVTLATDAAKTAKDKYTAAIAKYKTVLATWKTAKIANDSEFVSLNSLYNILDAAITANAKVNAAYIIAQTNLNGKKSRLNTLESNLANAETSTVAQFNVDQLAAAKITEAKWLVIYNSAVDAVAKGVRFSYTNGISGTWNGLEIYQDIIKDSQQQLIIEQAKLVKYKADMDNWAKQVATALAS